MPDRELLGEFELQVMLAVLLTAVAATACVVPALRAVRIEPREALREE